MCRESSDEEMMDREFPLSVRFDRMTATLSHALAKTRAQVKTIRLAKVLLIQYRWGYALSRGERVAEGRVRGRSFQSLQGRHQDPAIPSHWVHKARDIPVVAELPSVSDQISSY